MMFRLKQRLFSRTNRRQRQLCHVSSLGWHHKMAPQLSRCSRVPCGDLLFRCGKSERHQSLGLTHEPKHLVLVQYNARAPYDSNAWAARDTVPRIQCVCVCTCVCALYAYTHTHTHTVCSAEVALAQGHRSQYIETLRTHDLQTRRWYSMVRG